MGLLAAPPLQPPGLGPPVHLSSCPTRPLPALQPRAAGPAPSMGRSAINGARGAPGAGRDQRGPKRGTPGRNRDVEMETWRQRHGDGVWRQRLGGRDRDVETWTLEEVETETWRQRQGDREAERCGDPETRGQTDRERCGDPEIPDWAETAGWAGGQGRGPAEGSGVEVPRGLTWGRGRAQRQGDVAAETWRRQRRGETAGGRGSVGAGPGAPIPRLLVITCPEEAAGS